MDEAVATVDAYVRDGGSHIIAATNANKLWQLRHDARLRAVLQRSDLIIPEWAVVWGAARVGTPLRGHVGGISLMQRLLAAAPSRGWSVFFLGSRAEVVAAAAQRARGQWPGLRVVGCHHGYFAPSETEAVVEEIRLASPDLLFLAMGSPKQEYWMGDWARASGAKVTLGVGGSLDVLSGAKPDTPSWIRGTGFEWLFRLALDPRNLWKRYLLTNSWFVASVLREKARRSLERIWGTVRPSRPS